MCTSYEAPGQLEFEAFSLFPNADFEYRKEIYKDYLAPIFRRTADGLQTDAATFGLVPRNRIPAGVKVFDTMNARAETVGEKRSFSGAWNRLQLALIPCQSFFEPSYETGKAVRWRIGMADDTPCAIAGLWREWATQAGETALSMTMLTLNADDHPLLSKFHRPGVEKRGVVVLPPTHYNDWLACKSTDEARSFLRLLPAEMVTAGAYPLPPRRSKTSESESDAQSPLL